MMGMNEVLEAIGEHATDAEKLLEFIVDSDMGEALVEYLHCND